MKNILIFGIWGFVVALGGCGDKPIKTEGDTHKKENITQADTQNVNEGNSQANNTVVEESAEQSLTRPQSNAVRSAENYLNVAGFSRNGLIEQLSSDYGDGYDVADATIAVDSLDVDWNIQAVRSAENYLKITGFSCSGLIEQLSSSHGDKYTESQASHGAKEVGAC